MTLSKVIRNPQTTIAVKLLFIGFLLLVMMMLVGMIESLIYERYAYETQTKQEVTRTWGESQVLSGPILSIPYTTRNTYEVDGKEKYSFVDHTMHVSPDLLDINATMETTSLPKSIYDVWLYTMDINLKGNIPAELFEVENLDQIKWDQAFLTLGVSDSHGIEGNIKAVVNGSPIDFNPGSKISGMIGRGVSAAFNVIPSERLAFDISLVLRGSESINFLPIATESRVSIVSDWHSPGFIGVLSPSQREVSDSGFKVVWETGKFSKANPDKWIDNSVNLDHSTNNTFGVELIEPVNHYQKNTRSVKYAFLILSLTFLIFFFYEIANHTKVHPIQYLLVGLSLTVFYLLLIAFTEHLGFNRAYVIASTATIASIFLYTRPLFESTKKSLLLVLMMAGLYAYIYVLLQLEAYALLAGSVGVFTILSTIMYLTRKVDFYKTTT